MSRLYKPLDEWDEEELARGMPKRRNGQFNGRKPQWVDREVHEEAISRFTSLAKGDLRALVPQAIERIRWAITCDETDEDGRRIVPVSTSVDAAKWAVEHLVGKPTQRVEGEISVKLQAMLAHALVDPSQTSVGSTQPGQKGQTGGFGQPDDDEDGPPVDNGRRVLDAAVKELESGERAKSPRPGKLRTDQFEARVRVAEATKLRRSSSSSQTKRVIEPD